MTSSTGRSPCSGEQCATRAVLGRPCLGRAWRDRDAGGVVPHPPGPEEPCALSSDVLAPVPPLARTGLVRVGLERRKAFVVGASLLAMASVAILYFVATRAGMLGFATVGGLVFGIYYAVDAALMSEVLPSAQSRARDLGILSMANTGRSSPRPPARRSSASASVRPGVPGCDRRGCGEHGLHPADPVGALTGGSGSRSASVRPAPGEGPVTPSWRVAPDPGGPVFVLAFAVPALLVVVLGYALGHRLWTWVTAGTPLAAGAEAAGWTTGLLLLAGSLWLALARWRRSAHDRDR